MTELLKVRNLQIHAPKDNEKPIEIVKGVSFDVKKGEVVALIGESGSGKTTIALSALGYCKPGLKFFSGTVSLNGQDVLSLSPDKMRKLRGKKVAYLPQSAAATFNPALTIGEQVTESAILHGVFTQKQANRRAKDLYHALELPDPEHLGQRYPHQVSGGQLQRLMAAMALCGKPDLLILDEPTTALDVTTQIEVLKAFKKIIREENSAAIYVTHDLAVVAQVADHIIVLYNGKIQEQGPAKQIIENSNHDYTRRLMAAVRPAPAAGQRGSAFDDHIREVKALQAKGIMAGYGKIKNDNPAITVLRDVVVNIECGHAVGVIGESGCGKTTLARVVAGLLPAAKGNIILDGETLEHDLDNRNKDQLRKVQFVFQMADTALNPKHRIADILGRPLEFYFGFKGAEKRNRVSKLLQLVELPSEFADRHPQDLSGGQKQRINLARALAAEPEVLLCDEVTSALDSIVGAGVIKLLKKLRAETGVSFVFISHDLSTVSSFADQIVVLYAGRIVEQGPTNLVLSPPFHPYSHLLITSVPELRVGWLEDTLKKGTIAAGIAQDVQITDSGCQFYHRCPMAFNDICNKKTPPNRDVTDGHVIACHRTITDLNI